MGDILIIEKISIPEWFEMTNKADGYRCIPQTLLVTVSFGAFRGDVPIQYIPLDKEYKIREAVCKALSLTTVYMGQ